jgi:hypothetical protein
LEEAIGEFNKRLETLDEAQAAIEAETEEANLAAEITEAGAFRENAIDKRQDASRLLIELHKKADQVEGRDEDRQSVASGAGSSRSTASQLSNVQLPKLQLPKFDGSVTKWQQFWDNFEAVVDTSELPGISKFTYLQSLLEGDAKRTIEGLSLSNANYDVACQLLKERYGRKERIVFAHIQGLLGMGMLGHQQTAKTSDLRKLQEELLTHIRSLEVWDIKGVNYGVVLTPIILSRMPSDIRMEWAREGEGKEGDLSFLLKFLKQEIERRERSESFRQMSTPTTSTSSNSRQNPTPTSNNNKSHVSKNERKQKVPTASALQSVSSGMCGFCGKDHLTETCPDVMKLDFAGRKKQISDAKLCFRCLLKGHLAKGCKIKCANCGGSGHHKICCYGKKNHENQNADTDGREESKIALLCPNKQDKTFTVLQTAKVLVCGEKTVEATLMFDSGSDRTYVTTDLVKRAKLKPHSSVDISYAPFGGGKSGIQSRNVYRVRARGAYGSRGLQQFVATEVPIICSPLNRPSIPSQLVQSLPKVEFADDYCKEGPLRIDILVGLDQYWHLVGQGVIRIAEGTVAQETEFGWILSGSFGASQTCTETFQLLSLGDMSEEVLRKFWDLESIGICPQETVQDDHCLKEFEHSIIKNGNRYEVALPWKGDHPPLLNNESLARKRLGSLSRKFSMDPELKLRYNKVLSEMEQSGIIEEVSEESVPYSVFYLPHRPVVKESSSTTKIRPVFDASAPGINGVSLNDCLEAGPSLIPCLSEVLLRFRRWRYALTADISKAFLQISLRREDRDVHRFLWEVGGVERKMRFLRVTFGVTSSPFLLNATLKHHLATFPPSRVIDELEDNLYVDDWLSGADFEEEAVQMLSEAKSVMAEAGMSLSKWSSSSGLVCDQIGSLDDSSHTKVLGVVWDPKRDCFSFEGVELPEEVVPTKRIVLSFIARLFDPLGFTTPFVMLAKVLFQELWILGCQWDEELPADLCEVFKNWLQGLRMLKEWRIPRSFASFAWGEAMKCGIHLHAFGDASEKGYGAVVYLCVHSPSGEFSSSLVISKAKVAPLKRVTLPRLELLGSLLAARLLKFVSQALKLEDTMEYTCWTDSTVALAWIKGNPNGWKQFVSNRVREIQELTDPSRWKHCPGVDNPADLTTRGILADNLVVSDLWLKGPDWLGSLDPCEDPCEGRVEFDEVSAEESVLLVDSSCEVDEVYEYGRSSSFSKVLRVVGWIRRFVHNLKDKGERKTGDLSYVELSEAKAVVFKNVQQVAFGADIESLEKSGSLLKGSSLRGLDPFMGEDGLLRIKGRLQLSDLSFSEKHPVILPKGHVSKLIVRHHHLFLKHAGVNAVLTSLRASYWILGLRRLAKAVKRECFNCQRVDSQACRQPVAPLPKLRVSEAPPFSVTGVDYTGHLFCSDFPGRKFYICLFTCAVVRAVHLELTDSLTTADFLLALRRFAARRGMPSVLYSDNAQNFVGAEAELSAFFGHLSPEWKKIAPRAPWWGGFWERMVGSVKSSLRKSLGSRRLTRCELETTLHEIEGCINSRPLCFVGDDLDSGEPLTPNHFLLGKGAGFQARVLENLNEVSPSALSKREQVRCQMLDRFWEVWRTEYLVNLPAVGAGGRSRGDLQVGSVVLIQEDHTPRMQWDLGVVVEMFKGKDGVVRSAKLHTTNGPRVRAVQRLFDLEMINNDPNLPQVSQTKVPPNKESELKVEENKPDSSVVHRTRCGRVSRPAQRLDM